VTVRSRRAYLSGILGRSSDEHDQITEGRPETVMQHDSGAEVEATALADIATAAAELLERLQATSAPAERAALRTEFAARVDGIRADVGRRHGLTERHAVAVVARALAHVTELVRAAPTSGTDYPSPGS
jgi:hypothetical protein